MISLHRSNPTHLVLSIACLVFFIVSLSIGISNRHRVISRHALDPAHTINDFDRWMILLPEFLHQHADYLNDDFPNPPIAIAILAPFTLFSPANAQVASALMKFILVWASLLVVLKILKTTGEKLHPAVLALILFIWLWPVTSDLIDAQTNFYMFLPLVASLALLQSRTPRNDLLAGLLLALAISIKVTPLIFLPYLLLQRRWLAILATCLGLLLWLLLVPALLFGWTQNLAWLQQWSTIMLLPYLQHGTTVYIDNQSLPSSILRFCTHVPGFTTISPDGTKVPHYFNIISLSTAAATQLSRALIAILGIAGLLWLRRPLPNFRTPFYLVSIGAIAIFMLLASERTWTHHFITLLLPLVAVGMFIDNPNSTRLQHTTALLCLILAAISFPLGSDIGHLLGKVGPLYARALDNFLLPSLALLLFLTAITRNRPQPTAHIDNLKCV